MSQLLSIDKNELDVFAKFMGHDIATHRKYYRLPKEVVELTHLTKFFAHMEEGDMYKMCGKNLNRLPIPDDELDVDDVPG